MSEYNFENFFELSIDLLCIANIDGYLLRVNPSFQRILGWSNEELLSRPFIEFVHPDDQASALDELKKLASGIPVTSFTNRFCCSNGDYRHLLWTAYPESDTGFIFAIAHDTTEQIYANLRFQIALDAAPAALLMVDRQGTIQLINKEVENLFGYKREFLVGKSIEMLVPPTIHVQHQRDRVSFFQNPKARSMGTGRQVQAVRRDGFIFPVEIGLNPIVVEENTFVLCSVVDMTLQKQVEERMIHLANDLESANKQLAELATTDRLTDISNRRAFDEQINKYVQLAGRTKRILSLLLIDIDHFKKLNDTYGHWVGDETLKDVAQLIKDNARASDVAARFGGEEFALILPDTDKEGAVQMAERVREAIQSHPWKYEKVTASMGISSMLPTNDQQIMEHVQKLITSADQALYFSKGNGKNQANHASDLPEPNTAT